MKKLNIAIIGLGNIGSYLFKYLNKNNNFQILYINLKESKERNRVLKNSLSTVVRTVFQVNWSWFSHSNQYVLG